MSPALVGIEAELPKIPQESATTNGVTTLPRSTHDKQECTQVSTALDLSDVVGDFEATLKRSSKSTKAFDKEDRTENGQTYLSFVSIRSFRPIYRVVIAVSIKAACICNKIQFES